MSDTFDHEADAWNSYDWDMENESNYSPPRRCRSRGHPLTHRGTAKEYLISRGHGDLFDNGPDPDFYHDWFQIVGIVKETEKAYQLRMPEGFVMWVPKSICREFAGNPVKVKAHSGIFRSICDKARKEASLDGLPDLGVEEPDRWYDADNIITLDALPDLIREARVKQFGESGNETLVSFLLCEAFEARYDRGRSRALRLAAMIISRV